MSDTEKLLGLAVELLGKIPELAETVALYRRAAAGEVITDAEIEQARAMVRSATLRWDAAAENDRQE